MENQQELVWNADLIIRLSLVIILVLGTIIIFSLPPSKKAKELRKGWEKIGQPKNKE